MPASGIAGVSSSFFPVISGNLTLSLVQLPQLEMAVILYLKEEGLRRIPGEHGVSRDRICQLPSW